MAPRDNTEEKSVHRRTRTLLSTDLNGIGVQCRGRQDVSPPGEQGRLDRLKGAARGGGGGALGVVKNERMQRLGGDRAKRKTGRVVGGGGSDPHWLNDLQDIHDKQVHSLQNRQIYSLKGFIVSTHRLSCPARPPPPALSFVQTHAPTTFKTLSSPRRLHDLQDTLDKLMHFLPQLSDFVPPQNGFIVSAHRLTNITLLTLIATL